MTICLEKSCSFGLLLSVYVFSYFPFGFEGRIWDLIVSVPFVNCCQFMYLVISLLGLRAGYGIWLCQFLLIAYIFTLHIKTECNIIMNMVFQSKIMIMKTSSFSSAFNRQYWMMSSCSCVHFGVMITGDFKIHYIEIITSIVFFHLDI